MRTVGYVWTHHADASGEPDGSRDKQQCRPDDDHSDSSRRLLTGRREPFDGDGRRDDGHRAQVHDTGNEQDHHEIGATGTAAQPELYAMS